VLAARVVLAAQAARVALAPQVALAAPEVFKVPALPRNYEAALRDLGSDSAKVRAASVSDLARHDEDHRDDIIEALCHSLDEDGSSEVRAAAALALADLHAVEALDALMKHAESDGVHVRQMAITALGEISDERAEPVLRKAMRDEHAEIRFQATMAFVRVQKDRDKAVRALVEASRDADPEVVHIALRMAEELGHAAEPEGAVDPRIVERAKVLRAHESDQIAVIAAIILAREDVDLGRDVLVRAAGGEADVQDAEDITAAIELCGELKLEAATTGLERRAFGGILGLRGDPYAWHARAALARMGHTRAAESILKDLRSWDRHKRTLGVAAAARARLVAARPLIEAMKGRPGQADPASVEETLRVLESADDDEA